MRMYTHHSKRKFANICKAFTLMLVVFHITATASEFAQYDCSVDSTNCCCCAVAEDKDSAMSCCIVPERSHKKNASDTSIESPVISMGPVCGTDGLVNSLLQPLPDNFRERYENASARFTTRSLRNYPVANVSTDASPRGPPAINIT